jgi:hypothetical protein
VRKAGKLVAVLGALVLAGCAGKRPAAVAPRHEKIAVKVTNHHFLDVVVYAICEGQRTRIGVASGSGSTQMNVPRRLLGPGQEVQLIGDAIGSEERAVTETIIVQPGQFIELLLESRLARSSVGVY